MASETEICNIALQKVGAPNITSLTQDSANARRCNLAYEPMRDAELRAHTWNFSIKRVQLAADSTEPLFNYSRKFQLPSDFLRLAPRDPEDTTNYHDWKIEGRYIFTDDSSALDVRYVYRVTDPNEMDALFREALSCKIALQLCEVITQSNTKKQLLMDDYRLAIREARKVNAIENPSEELPEDTWITIRV